MSDNTAAADWNWIDFAAGKTPLPEPNLAWNTYGTGLENVGVDGAPEPAEIPEPGPDQLLIRVDAVGLCFSDVKLIKQGGDHPKLYGRDLTTEPTRLGHEVSVTVIEVGSELADRWSPGDRLAIQPDIYVDGRAAAYGYTVPGGLIQYHLIGPEVLAADHGAYVIPVNDDIGYAAAALSEPWACVEAAYTQRRRLEPLDGGTMWIVGDGSSAAVLTCSRGLDAPARIVLSDVPESVRALVAEKASAEIVERNGVSASSVAAIAAELAGETGLDDIVVVDPQHADLIEELAKAIAFRGTMTLVGTTPLDGLPLIDVGRIHYDYTAYLGTTGPDIAAAWGEDRNRADLVPGGTAVFVGAAGPMGQMHMQRAIESEDGPSVLIGSDLDDDRIEAARSMLQPLADRAGKTLVFLNPGSDPDALMNLIREHSAEGADDVIVSVPVGPVMGDAATLMSDTGMLVLFAGVPNGTMAPLDMSTVYLGNVQYTGTSGSSISDQEMVIDKALRGALSPGHALAAVGGIGAGREGVRALMEGDYAGKVVIFPQLQGLELQSLEELASADPEIGAALGENGTWTEEAERLLFEKYHAG